MVRRSALSDALASLESAGSACAICPGRAVTWDAATSIGSECLHAPAATLSAFQPLDECRDRPGAHLSRTGRRRLPSPMALRRPSPVRRRSRRPRTPSRRSRLSLGQPCRHAGGRIAAVTTNWRLSPGCDHCASRALRYTPRRHRAAPSIPVRLRLGHAGLAGTKLSRQASTSPRPRRALPPRAKAAPLHHARQGLSAPWPPPLQW
jgi:hypothetical protein